MTDPQDAALYYLVVRRFGTNGLYGKELDKWCKTMLRRKEVFDKVRKDYDIQMSESYVSDTTQFD